MRIIWFAIALVITALLACVVVLTAQRTQLYAQVQLDPQQQVAQQAEVPKPPQQGPAAPGPVMPNDDTLLILIRTTLIALNQANATSNYTVFREIGAPGFQSANSTAKLTEIFAKLRHGNIDMSAILSIQPKLLRKPTIDASSMLRVTGFFPTQPLQVNFDLAFQSVGAQWQLFGISVGTSPAQPLVIEPQPHPSRHRTPRRRQQGRGQWRQNLNGSKVPNLSGFFLQCLSRPSWYCRANCGLSPQFRT